MQLSRTILITAAFVTVQACIECPHPGNFTGKRKPYFNLRAAEDKGADVKQPVGWLRNATDSYCGAEDTPPHSIYASINATFFSIRE